MDAGKSNCIALKSIGNSSGKGLDPREIHERRSSVWLGGVEHYYPHPHLEENHTPDPRPVSVSIKGSVSDRGR